MDSNKKTPLYLEATDREKIEHTLKIAVHNKECLASDFIINPFDTQLGCRYPTLQERNFLVNLITLLGTPIGSDKPDNGVSDMAGLIIDELYKRAADDGEPDIYTVGIEKAIDGTLDETGFIKDSHTTWWEVTDALFLARFTHKAMLAQRYAVPRLGEVINICHTPSIENLYGKKTISTGETLIDAFLRVFSKAIYEHPMLLSSTMILPGIHEYPIVSQQTEFDSDKKTATCSDLSEIIKNNGDAVNRDLAIMHMLTRHILVRYLYSPNESMVNVPSAYQSYYENLRRR